MSVLKASGNHVKIKKRGAISLPIYLSSTIDTTFSHRFIKFLMTFEERFWGDKTSVQCRADLIERNVFSTYNLFDLNLFDSGNEYPLDAGSP